MTRDIAAAASLSPLFLISCAPMLSVMTLAFLRSTSCASAVEVTASRGASAVTVTVSANLAIVKPTLASMGVRLPAGTSILTMRSW